MKNDHVGAADPAEISKRVEEIWRDVLGMRDAPPSATFFELQGQSVSAVRIAARIEDELGISIDIGALFEDPSLEAFVADVVARAGDPEPLRP